MISRRLRFWSAVFATAMLVFAQLALAMHACVAEATQTGAYVADAAGGSLPSDCCGKTPSKSALCISHCNQDGQSLDKPQQPGVPSITAMAVDTAGLVIPTAYGKGAQAFVQPFLHRSTEPPLSIRNCCFRI